MSVVQTIRGPIESGELGWTLSHEHLTAGAAGMERLPWVFDEAEAASLNIEALGRVRQAGIQSMIDLTPLDLGRNMGLFRRVAEADTGVHVVCATGVYRWVPAYLMGREPDDVADHLLRELRDGIEGTGIRPGIIKLAWDLEYRLHDGPAGFTPRANLERTARGAARAAKVAGVPISCHTLAADELGTPLLDIFEDEGLDLRAVTIGHSNDSQDPEYLLRLVRRGANVGLDRFGVLRGEEEMARRAQLALGLIRAGFAEQVCLSHDGSPYMRFGAPRPPNLDCWLPVPTWEVPWLLEHGASQDDVDAVMVRSIRRTFEAAAAMAAPAK
ncbi:MAG: phosphotriesterase [Chloroflexi bacterium]|nr:phosphotriesterase [Chloroflexota bacterium]